MKLLIVATVTLLFGLSCGEQSARSNSNANVDPECQMPPPSDVDPITCCKIPELLESMHIDNCARKVFGNGPVPLQQQQPPPPQQQQSMQGQPQPPLNPSDVMFSPQIRCVSECIFNETGIFKDRKFQPEIALNAAKKVLAGQPTWIPVVEQSIKACNENAMKANIRDQGMCGHQAAFLVACLNTQLFRNCPQSSWTNARGCAKLRELTTKCPIVAPPQQ